MDGTINRRGWDGDRSGNEKGEKGKRSNHSGSRMFCRAEGKQSVRGKRPRAIKSKNVDMSNEKKSEKQNGRKSKGSNKARRVSRVKRALIKSWKASRDGKSRRRRREPKRSKKKSGREGERKDTSKEVRMQQKKEQETSPRKNAMAKDRTGNRHRWKNERTLRHRKNYCKGTRQNDSVT